MAAAFGGVRGVAKEAGLNPNQLYRMLSAEGNPGFRSLSTVLARHKGFGWRSSQF